MRWWSSVLGLLLLPGPVVCYAVPDVTMSFESASSGATITASEHNTVRNETSNKFNSHTHTDITFASIAERVHRTAGGVTTTSGTLVDFTGASITVTTDANPALVGFVGSCENTSATAIIVFNVDLDGSDLLGVEGINVEIPVADEAIPCGFVIQTADLTAGSHTFKLQWYVTAGTGTVQASTNNASQFWVVEVTD